MAIQYSNTKVSVAITSTTILSHVEKRLLAVLTNDSNETMYLGINEDAVLNEGTPLAVGEKMVIEEKDNLNVAIYAICASGTKNLAVSEVYLDAL